MEDNRDSYFVNALLDNYEEPLDISFVRAGLYDEIFLSQP